MIFAVGSTPWLLIHELRLARRSVLSRPGMKWRAPVVLIAFVFGGLAAGVPAALAVKRLGPPHTVTAETIAAVACLAAATLMLSQSLAAATETLYARGDLDLLFSSPISPARVLFARCAGIAANAFIGFALLITPVVLPVAVLADPAWLAVYGVLAALALLAASAGLAIAIGLFRLIGPRRTRTVSQLIAVLVGASLFLVAQGRNVIGGERFGRLTAALGSPALAGTAADGPLSWPLRAASGEAAPLVVMLAAACTTFALATAWVGRRFGSDVAAASGAAVGGTSSRGADGNFATGIFRVILRKELRLLGRDVPLLAQVLLRVVYLLPLTFILLRGAGNHGVARLPVAVGALALMCGQIAGSLVWLTVSAEDAPELIGCSPVSRLAVRRAKLCAALAPLAGLMTIPLAVLIATSPLAGLAAAAGCVAAALSSAMLGFALQKPAKRSAFGRRGAGSLVAALAEFGAGGVVGLASGAAVVWSPLILALLATAMLLGWLLWRGGEPPRRRLSKARAVVH